MKMLYLVSTLLLSILMLSACVVLPVNDPGHINKCEISSDRKTLKVVDGFKGTHTYYSISGLLVLMPITGIVSGSYVAINNIYNYGEEKIVCGSRANKT